jgi:hypothetical protein
MSIFEKIAKLFSRKKSSTTKQQNDSTIVELQGTLETQSALSSNSTTAMETTVEKCIKTIPQCGAIEFDKIDALIMRNRIDELEKQNKEFARSVIVLISAEFVKWAVLNEFTNTTTSGVFDKTNRDKVTRIVKNMHDAQSLSKSEDIKKRLKSFKTAVNKLFKKRNNVAHINDIDTLKDKIEIVKKLLYHYPDLQKEFPFEADLMKYNKVLINLNNGKN